MKESVYLRELEAGDMFEYLKFLKDMGNEKDIVPAACRMHRMSYPVFLIHLEKMKTENCGKYLVPSTLYVLVNKKGYIFGALHLRHRLNNHLEDFGGHIGYGIREEDRRKGLGTMLLQLGLQKCWDMGLTNILVTCDSKNIGSQRIIKKNGGVMHDMIYKHDDYVIRYWINLEETEETKKKKTVYIFNYQKDTDARRVIARISESLLIPLITHKDIVEHLYDHIPEIDHKLKIINRLGLDLLVLQLNGHLNLTDKVMLDLSVNQDDFMSVKKYIDDKGSCAVTIYIKEDDEILYRNYVDHYRDLHPAHKVCEMLLPDEFKELRYIHDLSKIPYNYITTIDLPNLEDEIKKLII